MATTDLQLISYLVQLLLDHRDAGQQLGPLGVDVAQRRPQPRCVHSLQPQQLVACAQHRRTQRRLRVHLFGKLLSEQ